ncbi:hypothetical protein KFK09_002219 [Dendrobium nobile]|uniref:Uncharacterized protein n=1 Tax=Dendrobium nobile TaxID=94219 RepID=A0A8T3CD61_DENNO|nr:hypothetical protein KFK09_002219 [Dendrobium nobile]
MDSPLNQKMGYLGWIGYANLPIKINFNQKKKNTSRRNLPSSLLPIQQKKGELSYVVVEGGEEIFIDSFKTLPHEAGEVEQVGTAGEEENKTLSLQLRQEKILKWP